MTSTYLHETYVYTANEEEIRRCAEKTGDHVRLAA